MEWGGCGGKEDDEEGYTGGCDVRGEMGGRDLKGRAEGEIVGGV